MTAEIYAHQETDSLEMVMEGLAAHRFGAVLIKSWNGLPAGVLSKTDLILAYKHGLPADTRAGDHHDLSGTGLRLPAPRWLTPSKP